MFKQTTIAAVFATLMAGAGSAGAAISASEADRLGKDLTPVGAEKAGNADGSIPEWTGGLTGAFPGWPNANNDRPNPHADDQVQFTISAENMDQYADKLPEIAKEMMKRYPEQFKMNVYPTRRTAAFPEAYYALVKENAQKAELVNNGDGVANVWGSIPFPIPSNGAEVIWNHLLRYKGTHAENYFGEDVVYDNGSRLQWTGPNVLEFPFQDVNDEKAKKEGILLRFALTEEEPARDRGEGTLAIDHLDPANKPRKAWSYDPGERRVRRAPTLSFDTPDRPVNVMDDWDLYNGSPEKYDWNLIGKQEMYIPYNNNKVNSPTIDREADFPNKGFISPDVLRYELHRVWIVEADVRQGARHVYAKRRFYIDEDTWTIVATEKYDGAGNLWRASFQYPVVAPEIPVATAGAIVHIDLKTAAYYVSMHSAGKKGWEFNGKKYPANYFTSAAMRRRGR